MLSCGAILGIVVWWCVSLPLHLVMLPESFESAPLHNWTQSAHPHNQQDGPGSVRLRFVPGTVSISGFQSDVSYPNWKGFVCVFIQFQSTVAQPHHPKRGADSHLANRFINLPCGPRIRCGFVSFSHRKTAESTRKGELNSINRFARDMWIGPFLGWWSEASVDLRERHMMPCRFLKVALAPGKTAPTVPVSGSRKGSCTWTETLQEALVRRRGATGATT